MAVSQRLARENPAVPNLKRELIVDHHNLGGMLRYQGRTAEAVRIYRASRKLEESLPRE